MNNTLQIAVLMGGPGSERKVSLASGNAVLEALKSEGLNAVGVDVTEHALDLPEGTALCFNTIHGTFGEDGEMQTILDDMDMPYTGAGAISSKLGFDKVESKKAFIEHGVPTPASEIVFSDQGITFPQMSLPYVVKPPREGSSVGVHIVRTQEEAEVALTDAAKYSDDVLIEQFVEGKELTVGILDGVALPIVHIVPRDGFYDMANKYPWMTGDGGTDYFCPAELDEETTAKVQAAALAAYNSLGVEIYARVDVLLDADNNPYVLEANTIPGMTASSLLPKSAQAAGIEFGPLCKKIAELSLAFRAS
ncbi:MAG: D-alanine--D-alanine ligase [Akkermansiaceae bacterium]